MRHIHNTSFIINESIESDWVNFIREHYIAPLKNTDLCEDVIFTKVSIDQAEGKTYSIQTIFHSENQMGHFLETSLPAIENKIIKHYQNSYVCFSSILTEI